MGPATRSEARSGRSLADPTKPPRLVVD